eukprot:503861-Amorphochlora_amoeboformis.AAC.1
MHPGDLREIFSRALASLPHLSRPQGSLRRPGCRLSREHTSKAMKTAERREERYIMIGESEYDTVQ